MVLEYDLEIILVLNKIDLLGVELEWVKEEIEEIIGLDCLGVILVFVKEGIGILEILEFIV